MKKFEPTGHRVVLKPDMQFQTKSGIVLHYDERRVASECDTGTITHIGPTAWKSPFYKEGKLVYDGLPWAKVGDRVYFSKYGVKVLKEGDEYFIIANDEDILAIIDEPAEESVNEQPRI